jgi:hypothetical protein
LSDVTVKENIFHSFWSLRYRAALCELRHQQAHFFPWVKAAAYGKIERKVYGEGFRGKGQFTLKKAETLNFSAFLFRNRLF